MEVILRAWVISNVDNPQRQDVEKLFGPRDDLEWFANNVPYHVSGKNIDILCYHKNKKYTGIPLRYKFRVVELKRDRANDQNILQVIEYSKWVAGRLAGSEIETVQPILIAFDFNRKALEKARNSDFNERDILLVKYRVENGDVTLEAIDY